MHANLTSQQNRILPHFFIYFNIDTLPFPSPLSFFFFSFSSLFFNIHISIMYLLFAICPSTLSAMFKKIDLYVTFSLSHFRSSRIVSLCLMCTLSELDSREFIDPSTHDRQRNGGRGGEVKEEAEARFQGTTDIDRRARGLNLPSIHSRPGIRGI